MSELVLRSHLCEKVVRGLVELDNLARLGGDHVDIFLLLLLLFASKRLQSQSVTSVLCLFSTAAVKVQAHLNVEFAVSSFLDLKGGGFDGARGVGVGHVQFELDFFEPGGDFRAAVDGFDVDAPAFCVAFWDGVGLRGRVKVPCL